MLSPGEDGIYFGLSLLGKLLLDCLVNYQKFVTNLNIIKQEPT